MAEQLEPQPVERIEETVVVETAVVDPSAPTTLVVPVIPMRPRKTHSGMWGTPEIIAVAAGAMTLLVVTLLYFFFVLPSDRELARNKSETDRLEAEAISARSKYGEITTTESQVNKLLASVDDFQTRYLPVASNGQGALYQRLNGLILGYGLLNTTGPDYAPLETADLNAQQQADEERGRAKYRSLFPGVYVTMTVEGPYQNLRRFLREIETGREFIVVSTVELAPSDSEKPAQTITTTPVAGGIKPVPPSQPFPAAQRPAGPKGKMHGEIVSLHIELAAYFRRPDFAPMIQQEQP